MLQEDDRMVSGTNKLKTADKTTAYRPTIQLSPKILCDTHHTLVAD